MYIAAIRGNQLGHRLGRVRQSMRTARNRSDTYIVDRFRGSRWTGPHVASFATPELDECAQARRREQADDAILR